VILLREQLAQGDPYENARRVARIGVAVGTGTSANANGCMKGALVGGVAVAWPVMALWVPRQGMSLGITRQTNVRTRLRIANGCAGSAVCVPDSRDIIYAKRAEH
jgi:hypothetical protein